MADEPTPDDPALVELVEITAFLCDNVDRIPAHRRRQAVLGLERVERLVPLADAEADDLDAEDAP